MILILTTLALGALFTSAAVLHSDVAEPYQPRDPEEVRLLDDASVEDES